MQWDDLRIFLAVARECSISGGAARLGVQHSTASRRIRSLEAGLGTTLFERKKSGFELTGAGSELRDSAERIEREVVGLEGVLSNQDNKAYPFHSGEHDMLSPLRRRLWYGAQL